MKKLSTEEEPEDILYQQNISTNQFLLITLTSCLTQFVVMKLLLKSILH